MVFELVFIREAEPIERVARMEPSEIRELLDSTSFHPGYALELGPIALTVDRLVSAHRA
jgi:hypothetical protein